MLGDQKKRNYTGDGSILKSTQAKGPHLFRQSHKWPYESNASHKSALGVCGQTYDCACIYCVTELYPRTRQVPALCTCAGLG
eukprot:scaffold221728_cov23-Tisochrysis_lutea.AAC.1